MISRASQLAAGCWHDYSRSRSSTRPARWTPRRLLLVNIHNYTAQELLFSPQGWLLLRGANGSGKSTALEASLPFVLDADLQRFAAASGASRSWRTALLPNQEIRHRTGHVAIEWEGPDGSWLTTGATLDAQVGKAEVEHFHWLTTQRVGVSYLRTYLDSKCAHADSLLLVDGEGQPLRIKDIKDLRDDGRMLAQTAKRDEWHGHINRHMFGFADEEDLRRHLRTLHTVRNISRAVEDNNPDSFSRRLLDGLPELDAATLADVRDALEGVRRYADDLASARAAAERLTEIRGAYGEYVARVVRWRSDRLLDARDLAVSTKQHRDRLAGEHVGARTDVERLAEDGKDAENAARGARAAHEELKHSDEAEPVRRLTRARIQASGSEQEAADSGRRARDDAAESDRAVTVRDDLEAALTETLDAQQAATAAAGLHLREAGGPPIEWLGAISAAIGARRLAVDEQARLRRDEATARRERDRSELAAESARAERDKRQFARDQAEEVSASERDGLVSGLAAWAARPPLNLPADRARTLVEEHLNGGPDQLEAKLRERTGDVERELGTLGSQRDELSKAAERLEHQLELARTATDPPVELPAWLGEDDREPLWRVAEFAEQLDDAARDELESALEASGLLFATLGAVRTGTATLRSQPASVVVPGRTVADTLVVGGPNAAEWHAVLSQIPLGPSTDGRLSIQRSSWTAGPLTVTPGARPARLIGHAARERARQDRIAALERELAELAVERERLAALLAVAGELRAALEQQRQLRPSDAAFRTAVQAAVSAEAVLVAVTAQAVKAEETARLVGEALTDAVAACTAHAADHALAGDLDTVRDRLDGADEQVRAARQHEARIDGNDGLRARHAAAAETTTRWAARAAESRDESATATAKASTDGTILAELEASIGEAAAAFDARLKALEDTWKAAEAEVKRLAAKGVEATERAAGLRVELETADRDLERHQAACARALQDFHALDDEGILAAITDRVHAVALAIPDGRDNGVLEGVDVDALLTDIAAGSSRFPAADPTRSRQRVEELVRSAQAHTAVTHTTVLGDVLWVFRPDAEGGTSLRRLHAVRSLTETATKSCSMRASAGSSRTT